MSGKNCVVYDKDIIYCYDGSLKGFLCCVFDAISLKEMPYAITTNKNMQPSLLPCKLIESCDKKALRIKKSIIKNVCYDAWQLLEHIFLSEMKDKEIAMLKFIIASYRYQANIMRMIADPVVAPLLKAERHIYNEAHLYKGFVRFSDYDGVLVAAITPKNFILPFLKHHFVDRYYNENFMIYDKTNHAALIYEDKKASIIPLSAVEFAQATKTEMAYRALWQKFYDTIAVEGRENPKCRMGHMPKRYWQDMTEFNR